MITYLPLVEGREIEWLELNLLKKEIPISKSTLLSITGRDEEVVDSWLSEIDLRNSELTTPYYQQNGNNIIPLVGWKDVPEYFLCLYFTCYGASNNHNGTKLFEKISAIALKNFIGGEVYALGFPAGINLNEHLDAIAAKCFEHRGKPAHIDYKDDGVDVICYKSFGDRKSSNLYVLLQCAAGIHWRNKKTINTGRWTHYIFWFSNNIITSIATTEYISNNSWDKDSSEYGMLLDRLRINNWYYKNYEESFHEEVINWCENIEFE